MTDLEITRLCAEAMGYSKIIRLGDAVHDARGFSSTVRTRPEPYLPLTNDAQAMMLVKKFQMRLQEPEGETDKRWRVTIWDPKHVSKDADLNHAICECVAKMEQAKVQT